MGGSRERWEAKEKEGKLKRKRGG